MVNDNIHLPREGKWAKLLADPTEPRPGPTFPMLAAEPEKAESPSTPIPVNRTAETNTMPTYKSPDSRAQIDRSID